MKLRSIKEVKRLKGKKILLRAGFDVPLNEAGRVVNDFRLRSGIPTIKYLVKNGAAVIIVNHLGRPGGKKDKKLSNKAVARKLSKLLNKKVVQLNEVVGNRVGEVVTRLLPGDIIMLENVRFHPGEKVNCHRLARILASYGDLFVNDAFSASHRKTASVVAITAFLPSYAGLLLADEIRNLDKVLTSKLRPKVAIIGGAKLKTKVGVIKNLLTKMDCLLLGGAVANNVLKDMNYEIGLSKSDKIQLRIVSNILLNKLKIPLDVVVAKSLLARARNQIKAVAEIAKNDIILDIGPDTVRLYSEIIKSAKLVVWNGPLGYFEIEKYKKSSQDIAKTIAESKTYSTIGGGETVEMIQGLGLIKKFNFVSTGGGAMLEFLEGKILPGIKPLIINKKYAKNKKN